MENKGGLTSLLSDSGMVVQNRIAGFGGVSQIDIEHLVVSKSQPRTFFEENLIEELAESIRIHGLIQPITARMIGKNQFEIISGERRFRASKLAGLQQVPVYLRHVDDANVLEMAIVENIQRENLNPIEIALSFKRMIDECELSQDELSGRVGKSRPAVANYLRLLNLPTEIQSALVLGVISMGQAKPLISLNDKNRQLEIFERIMDLQLTSREVEAIVKKGGIFEAGANELDLFKEDIRIEELTLRGKTKVPISIQIQDINKGNIKIKFGSMEELDEILKQLS